MSLRKSWTGWLTGLWGGLTCSRSWNEVDRADDCLLETFVPMTFFLLLATVNFCPVGTCLSTRGTGNLNFETISLTALHVEACNRNRVMVMHLYALNKILSWLQSRGIWRMIWGSLNIVKDKKKFFSRI